MGETANGRMGETANGRHGDTATRRHGAVGRKTRRAQDVANWLTGLAPVLSRAVGVASPNVILNQVRDRAGFR